MGRLCVTTWINKSILFSVFLLEFFPIETATAKHIEFGIVIVDLTKQLNEVISGDISKSNFSRTLYFSPLFGVNNLSTSSMTVLYNSDCNILEAEQCSRQIQSVAELLNESIPGPLTIFLTVNIQTVIELYETRNTTKIELPNLPLNLVVNLHEKTKCEDLKRAGFRTWDNLSNTSSWIPLRPTTKVGFAYSEALIECYDVFRIDLSKHADFFVLTMKFGNTVGVTESFGLFQKRMNSLHSIAGVHVDLHRSLVRGEEHPLLEPLINKAENFNFDIGILINSSSCLTTAEAILRNQASKQFKKMFLKLNYIVCKSELEVLSQDDKLNLGYAFDTHLYLKRIFQQIRSNLKIYFRVEISVTLNKNKETINRYLILLSHFHKFGSAYDINYFIVKAFDGDIKRGQENGWWAVKKYTDLTNPYSFVEKASVYFGVEMWRPSVPNTNVAVANSRIYVIVASVSSLLLLLLAFVGSILVMRYKKQLSRYLTDREVQEFINGKENPKKGTTDEESMSASVAEYMKFKADYDIPKADFSIDNESVLGTGNFGTVYKGSARGKEAAIKKPNQDCPKGTFKTVLTEIKVLSYIGMHPNIVTFFGAYVKEIHKGILFVATEYCSNGSLRSYLRKKKQVIDQKDDSVYQDTQLEDFLYSHELHQFSIDIANGMAYIESKHVVHGDLAARNVLLDEYFNCKIGDFGLSRKLYEYQKYVKKSQEPLPWKWMAYESLTKMEFTSKSDVWSYGVTLWEIYSLGKAPYGGLNWTTEFADELQNGLRLTKPQFANEEIYSKMLDCWNLDVENRPRFSEISELLKSFCSSSYKVLSE